MARPMDLHVTVTVDAAALKALVHDEVVRLNALDRRQVGRSPDCQGGDHSGCSPKLLCNKRLH